LTNVDALLEDTLDTMDSLARVYAAEGKVQDAEVLYVECVRTRIGAYGKLHPKTLKSMYSLAKLHVEQVVATLPYL